MKRLLYSLLFGITFPAFYLGFLVVATLVREHFFSTPIRESSFIPVLALPVTWSGVIFQLFTTGKIGYIRFSITPISLLWAITANIALYSMLFYSVQVLISRRKKPKQDAEQPPPTAPPFSWSD